MDAHVPRDRHPSQRYVERLAARMVERLNNDVMVRQQALTDVQLTTIEYWMRWTMLDEAAYLREQDRDR